MADGGTWTHLMRTTRTAGLRTAAFAGFGSARSVSGAPSRSCQSVCLSRVGRLSPEATGTRVRQMARLPRQAGVFVATDRFPTATATAAA